MKKKLFAFLLCSVLLCSQTSFVFAENINTEGEVQIPVNAEKSSEWIITIPETITLNTSTDEAGNPVITTINISIKADINPAETLSLTVKDDYNETSKTDALITNIVKGLSIPVQLSLSETTFTSETENINSEDGIISVLSLLPTQKISAGDWSGTVTFTIELQ